MFIGEIKEICAMMKMKQLSGNAVKLRFFPFSLRDNVNKWLYNLPTNSITTWAEFLAVFLKKILLNA